jgi:hypothetical protein
VGGLTYGSSETSFLYAADQKCSAMVFSTGSVAQPVSNAGSIVEDKRPPAWGLFPALNAGGKASPS